MTPERVEHIETMFRRHPGHPGNTELALELVEAVKGLSPKPKPEAKEPEVAKEPEEPRHDEHEPKKHHAAKKPHEK